MLSVDDLAAVTKVQSMYRQKSAAEQANAKRGGKKNWHRLKVLHQWKKMVNYSNLNFSVAYTPDLRLEVGCEAVQCGFSREGTQLCIAARGTTTRGQLRGKIHVISMEDPTNRKELQSAGEVFAVREIVDYGSLLRCLTGLFLVWISLTSLWMAAPSLLWVAQGAWSCGI